MSDSNLIEQLLDKDLWILRALVLAYYRGAQSESEWDPQDAIGTAAFALNHASNTTGIGLVWVNHELRAPMLFLDCHRLLEALGEAELVGESAPVPQVLINRVPHELHLFLTHFIDASTGSPSKE